MVVTAPFQTLFAVPLKCDDCVKDVSGALYKLEGIKKVEANLKEQLVSIEGTAAPSAIVEAIQSTGRDAILRGSGQTNGAAVAILETFCGLPGEAISFSNPQSRIVRGLARFVQVATTSPSSGSGQDGKQEPPLTLVDLTLRGVAPGKYRATIRQAGDLSEGATSTGGVWEDKGFLGTLDIGESGRGSVFLACEGLAVWEVVGRAMVVTRQEESSGGPEAGADGNVKGNGLINDENTLVGVIARSAGVWDNDKTVCSCTGRTLWQEREEEVGRGML